MHNQATAAATAPAAGIIRKALDTYGHLAPLWHTESFETFAERIRRHDPQARDVAQAVEKTPGQIRRLWRGVTASWEA